MWTRARCTGRSRSRCCGRGLTRTTRERHRAAGRIDAHRALRGESGSLARVTRREGCDRRNPFHGGHARGQRRQQPASGPRGDGARTAADGRGGQRGAGRTRHRHGGLPGRGSEVLYDCGDRSASAAGARRSSVSREWKQTIAEIEQEIRERDCARFDAGRKPAAESGRRDRDGHVGNDDRTSRWALSSTCARRRAEGDEAS